MELIRKFKHNYDRIKAELKGEAKSHGRMIRQARDINGISEALDPTIPAQPIKGAVIRMLDGKPMVFCTDGSLRHALGRKTTKAARKALKKARQAANKQK